MLWRQHKKGGKRSLRSRKPGVQGGMKLKKDQAYRVRQLIKEKLPMSVFNINERDNKVLRFCFAKKRETLEKAAEILCKI